MLGGAENELKIYEESIKLKFQRNEKLEQFKQRRILDVEQANKKLAEETHAQQMLEAIHQ